MVRGVAPIVTKMNDSSPSAEFDVTRVGLFYLIVLHDRRGMRHQYSSPIYVIN